MKKCLLLILLFLGLQINYAQDDLRCTEQHLETLQNCLMGNGINYTFIYSGNSIYIQGRGNPPPGKIQSCSSQYNNDTRDCPEAPVLINHPHLN